MRRRRIAAVVPAMIAVSFSASSAFPQSRSGLILALPTSPRSLGMFDLTVAASPDAWSTFSAPALLPRITGASGAIASEAYLVSTQLSAAAATFPLGRGALGVGATLLDYGTVTEIAAGTNGTDGTETGRSVSAQDHALVIAYGERMGSSERVTFGLAIEMLSSRIADLSATGYAGSAGVNWVTRRGWNVAAGVHHLGPAMKLGATRASIPTSIRLATSAPAARLGPMRVQRVVELRTSESGSTLAGAVEGEWSNGAGAALQIRFGAGLRSDHDDDRSPLSGGVGLVLGSWAIDYAPQHFRTIGQFTHRFGVRYARQSRAAEGAAPK